MAALLTQESDIGQLSRQEAKESTDRYLSYYQNDLAVLDWDAALAVQEPQQLDEILYVLELANLQLAELEAYDRLLDTPWSAPTATWPRPARARARRGDAANCAKSALIWPASATSCPTSPSSSATGTWPAFTRTSPPGSIWPTGTGPLMRSSRPWTTSTNCSTRTGQPLDAHPGSDDRGAFRAGFARPAPGVEKGVKGRRRGAAFFGQRRR